MIFAKLLKYFGWTKPKPSRVGWKVSRETVWLPCDDCGEHVPTPVWAWVSPNGKQRMLFPLTRDGAYTVQGVN